MLLAVRSAHKRFDGEVALDDASLDLRAGEVHALMGENGAGKSTLIKLLAGVEAADAMELTIEGRPARVRAPRDAHRLGLRFIHQELNVVPALSVAENVFLGRAYPRRASGLVHWRALRRRARATLEGLGIGHVDPAETMSRLGTGYAVLVSIARAFVEDEGEAPRVYVMDEPTAALSRRETELLFDVIRGLRGSGAGILYVSHRMEEIFEIADRITVLRDGRVVRTSERADTTRGALIRDMTGRELPRTGRASDAAGDPRTGADAVANGTVAPALEARNLRSRRLRDVSFRVAPGEVVGVTGLAGAGRSALLETLLGVDRRRAGTVLLDGRPSRVRGPAEAWRSGIAYVPEERRSQALVMRGDVRANLLLPHWARVSVLGVPRPAAVREEVRRWSREVGLRARGPHQVVHELSGGNQQKLVLARALAARPRVLLLDEPTRGVDVGAKFDIYRLVRDAAGRGAAVLLASSDLAEVLAVCDRVLVMRDGAIAHERDASGLGRGELLELCYTEAADGVAA